MARVLCGISGIEFKVDHLPIYLSSREYAHPIFFLNPRKLLGLYQKYTQNELDSTSSYLLFLAYMNSTDLVEWRVPAARTPRTDKIIAGNFQSLVHTVEKINTIHSPNVHFSRISVSPDTKNLENVHFWIESWKSTIEDFTAGNRAAAKQKSLLEIETKLEYLIKSASRNESVLAANLAIWASRAGSFPQTPVNINGTVTTTDRHWQSIMRKCVSGESMLAVERADIAKLLEHCELNLEPGDIFSHNTLKLIRDGMAKQCAYLGHEFSPIPQSTFQFHIIEQGESTEAANMSSVASTAPSQEPRRIDYPSQFAYIRAKAAWYIKSEMDTAAPDSNESTDQFDHNI